MSQQASHLQQQLVLHDPLDRLDQQVGDLQPVVQSLLQLLTEGKGQTFTPGSTVMATLRLHLRKARISPHKRHAVLLTHMYSCGTGPYLEVGVDVFGDDVL